MTAIRPGMPVLTPPTSPATGQPAFSAARAELMLAMGLTPPPTVSAIQDTAARAERVARLTEAPTPIAARPDPEKPSRPGSLLDIRV